VTIRVPDPQEARQLPGRSHERTGCPSHAGGHLNATDSHARLEAALDEVTSVLQRHRVVETWTRNQATRQREVVEALVHRQNLAELYQRLRTLHPADIA
jgi:hypothetical protein